MLLPPFTFTAAGQRADAGREVGVEVQAAIIRYVLRAYLYLAAAIALEVAGTVSLRLSDGFRVPEWTAVVVVGYFGSIWVFARALHLGLGLGVAYATLTGTGLIAAAVISTTAFDEPLGMAEAAGLVALLLGVVLLQPRRETGEPA